MNMRAPSVPLITIDPYFSVWSHDDLNQTRPYHWTGNPNTILGLVRIDGEEYRFLGAENGPVLNQVSLDVDALTTTAVFANDKIRLTARFTSPLLIEDLYLSSRPVSYLHLSWEALDGLEHTVSVWIHCSEELNMNRKLQGPTVNGPVEIRNGVCVYNGNQFQRPLHQAGDNILIDWGYFYLAIRGQGKVHNGKVYGYWGVNGETELKNDALFAFAYDDIHSLMYFGEPIDAYWKQQGKGILEVIDEALADYESVMEKCAAFNARLTAEALEKGGAQYAQLVKLSYRQVMAAHKLAVDTEGNNLYISKECFSNGCAATVDVTYPSAPLFLRYNPELLKGMLRPVCRYARSDHWKYDFAPHDVGTYPILNGQTYCQNRLEGQMPIEECGNMIILMAAICQADGSCDFAGQYMDLLETWKKYLVEYGEDPGNQLCTDDFAGHLAHNVNLAIKAIMGIAGYARILEGLGRTEEATWHMEMARKYAASVCARARNEDGSYRLAFDQPGTFSLKYNAVWDRLWATNLFPQEFYRGEMARYRKEALPCGIPLDSRKTYTKSDWIHWVCCMGSREDFADFTARLWSAFDQMDNRVPMCDWYYADTGAYRGFQARTVQGGLFMRYLFD